MEAALKAFLGSSISSKGDSNNNKSNSSNPLLSDRINENKTQGAIVCDPGGPFQEFVLRVEDATILHLSECLGSLDLSIPASSFLTASARLGSSDGYGATYARSPIGQIRISIRIAAKHNPVQLIDWIETVLNKISEKDDRVKPLGREALRTHAKSLAVLKLQFLTYFPLDDEPLAEVIHINRSQFQQLNENGTVKNLGIEVTRCGSLQVRGMYVPIPGTEHPSYSNTQGYIITRIKRTVSSVRQDKNPTIFLMPNQKVAVNFDEKTDSIGSEADMKSNDNSNNLSDVETEDEISLFMWYITNPALSSVYYYCASIEPSPLPPALGWQQISLGTFPTPMLQVGVINSGSVNKNETVDSFRPLDPSNFAFIQNKEQEDDLDLNEESSEHSKIIDRIKMCRSLREFDRSIANLANIREHSSQTKHEEIQYKKVNDVDEYLNPDDDKISGDAVLNEIRQISESRLEDTNILKSLLDRCSTLEKKCLDEHKLIQDKKLWLESCTTDELLLGFANTISSNNANDLSNTKVLKDIDYSKFDATWDLDCVLQSIRDNERANRSHELAKQSSPAPSDMLRRLRQGFFGSNSRSLNNMHLLSNEDSYNSSNSKIMFEAIGDVISSVPENSHHELHTPYKTHRKTLSSPSILQSPYDYIPNISETGTEETQSADLAHDEMTTRCLSDLIEMTVPDLRSQILNAEVSILGVEIWPPFKGSKIKNPDKLTYVLRVNLSDIRATNEIYERPNSTTPSMTIVSETSSDSGNVENNNDNQASAVKSDFATAIPIDDASVANLPPNSENEQTSITPLSLSVGARATLLSEDSDNKEILKRSDDVFSKSFVKGSSFESASTASVGSNVPHISGRKVEKKTAFALFAKEAMHRFDSRMNVDGRHVFTVRRDLPTLCAFHAELTQLLHGTDIIPPPFPDPFTIGNLEEDVIRSLNKNTSNKKKMRIGQPFLYNEKMRLIMKVKECDIGDPRVMDGAMRSIEEYIQGVFALIELIEDHAIDLKQEHHKNASPNQFSATLDSLDDQDRATPVSKNDSPSSFSEFIEKNDDDNVNISYLISLPAKLGKLMGSFLQASDLEDVVMKRTREGEGRSGSPRTVSPFSLKSESREHLHFISSSLNTKFQHPCWYPYASSGLRFSLVVHDDFGGRLSLKSEEELLRNQRSKCIGCGEPLLSGFLGLDRNYLPCRYHGGLFCKRWCHADDHRVIPHRILLYWDKTPHRVCRQAAIFLDYIWSKPLLKLKFINPLLYEGVPILRMTKSLRSRISILLDSMIDIDAEQVRDCLLAILGPNRIHLCITDELYSMKDIVNIQSGYLLKDLQDLIENLITVAPTTAFLAQQSDIDDNRNLDITQIAYITQRFTC